MEFGPQVAGREDADVSAAIRELFQDEGITVHLRTEVRSVRGESGTGVQLVASGPDGEGVIEGMDLLISVGVRRGGQRDDGHGTDSNGRARSVHGAAERERPTAP